MAKSAVTNRFLLRDMGTSLSFVLTNRARVKTSNILRGLTNFTISAWIKIPTFSQPTSGGKIYSERHASAGNDIINFIISSVAQPNKLSFQYRDDAGTLNLIVSDLLDGSFLRKWKHVALVKAGTGITFYIDGVASGTGTLTATNTMTDSVQSDFGNDPRDANSTLLGLMDDMQLNSTNLSASEIQSIYYRGLTAASAVGRWKCNEGSGTALIDDTGTQANGVITGATYSSDVRLKPRSVSTRSVAATNRTLS